MNIFPIEPLRQAFLELPEKTDSVTKLIDIKYFYVPSSHIKALYPDNVLVEGIRGAGKSEWWLELQDAERCKLVADLSRRTDLMIFKCSAGFGQKHSENFPSKDVLVELLKTIDAEIIWRTVVTWAILKADGFGVSDDTLWKDRINYYQQHFEQLDNRLTQIDKQLHTNGQKHLVLFDSLERTANDWTSITKLLKGLLQASLHFLSYRAIRTKIFVRPDMLEDATVYAFPDGSKLYNNRVSLEWNKLELFNLLWQYLGNAGKGGDIFRNHCAEHFGQRWQKHSDFDVWIIPESMRKDETLQRNIFHALAGQWMGTDARRGYPYTWLPNHLGDSYGKVSPRSFLVALREAAEDNQTKGQKQPLSYQAIKKGVQKASQIRVTELTEDYPWLKTLMNPLKGTNVPCAFEAVIKAWEDNNVIEKLNAATQDADQQLPPSRLERGFSGIKQDLADLGIFIVMRDGRINIPDVYRVGYGLGRKGGIKPVK